MNPTRQIRTALRGARVEEGGFTLVESMIAAMLLVLGSLGVLQVLDAGTRNTFRAEESQVINDRLQRELEAIRRLPFDEIALTTAPVRITDANDPRWRVSFDRTSYAIGRNGTNLRAFAVNGTPSPSGEAVEQGVVSAEPTAFTAGDVSGQIFRFITWTSDPSCAACGSGAMKRVIVAARIDEAPTSFDRAFQEIQTDVVDPDITPDDNPAPPDDEVDTATSQFWLTDTPCSFAERQEIVADHLAHNTRGRCDDGLQTGETRGAPDLMYIEAPTGPSGQPPYDYATDAGAEPVVDPNLDKGLAMRWSSTDSCLLQPVLNTVDVKRVLEGLSSSLSLPALPGAHDGLLDLGGTEDSKQLRTHTWLSPKVGAGGGALLGRGTLELFTKTVNGATHPGELCVWMFIRQKVSLPVQVCELVCLPAQTVEVEVDFPVINVGQLADGSCRSGTGANLTNFSYSQSTWPRNWIEISIPLCFAAVDSAGTVIPIVLPPQSQIGVTVMPKKSGTQPGDGFELMYDAVGFESRLELETDRILPF